jgi:maltose alpha-D-glucosyltransferase/alpha-amylase
MKQATREGLDQDPYWYKSGVIYELHVRAFCDSNGDGVGDFRGLTSKLDYLKDLGVTALWLLPFYPSPLRDDGYDISDYYNVHPNYGTLDDFKLFRREAHKRGLRVITELVLNHTSEQHPWFQRARRAKPGSRWRSFYVWSDTPEKYKDTRIIFKDVELSNWTWDAVANAYYWHRFFSHQPDLNYDNPEVFDEMVRALDFWLDLGVDGVRLDAVPYLYEREGSSCENLPETHDALKRLRAHVDAKYGDRMLLGEANQWPEDAVAYFGGGKGDECHMAFHFPLMPRLFMALRMEDRTPIVDILEQTPPAPETAQWALFLRNHDELTLEMVTDEERDYMYRMYAHVHQARLNLGIRRRLGPLLGNDRKRIELLNALLFSLPGTPVLYYGDEIGMGENIFLGDRNGVRTPMQWNSDKNAGFSRANPQALFLPIIQDPEFHYEACNVEAQLGNPHSLLWWMRRLLALRKKWRALGEGRCEFLQPENRRILSYVLRHGDETLLVVANLSRFVQPVELDLSAFKSRVPIELFGRTEFPHISESPYLLTLGPHSFYWFSIEAKRAPGETTSAAGVPPKLSVTNDWTAVFSGRSKTALETVLPDYLRAQRWFGGKAKTVKQVTVKDAIPVKTEMPVGFVTLLQVDYVQAEPEFYSLPLAFASGEAAERIRTKFPHWIVADLSVDNGTLGVLHDGLAGPEFSRALLDSIMAGHSSKGSLGELEGAQVAAIPPSQPDAMGSMPVVGNMEQSNSSVIFGERIMLKLFRRLHVGTNPDLEINRYLTLKEFPHIPRLAGSLEYLAENGDRFSVAVVTGYVRDTKDGWTVTLDALGRYYDRASTRHAKEETPPALNGELPGKRTEELPPFVQELIGTYLESARLLAHRTAELHLALSAETEDKRFTPEPFTPHYVRGLFQSMRNVATQNLRLLRKQLKTLPPEIVALAERVLPFEAEIISRYRPIYERRLKAKRIRIHGDYHLGQVLWTGRDFLILDFEGEPSIAVSERRIKRSPLKDVAGMIRSFHYAAYAALYKHIERGSLPPENMATFEPWARFWNDAISAAFLRAYLEAFSSSDVVPTVTEELQVMLQAYLLDKAMYELGYELNNRPAWLRIPLQGVLHLMETSKKK